MEILYDDKVYYIVEGESFNDLFIRYPELVDNKDNLSVELVPQEKNSVLITNYLQSINESSSCSDTDNIKMDNLARKQRLILDMMVHNIIKDNTIDEDFKDNTHIKKLVEARMLVDMKMGGVPKGIIIKKI